MGNPLKALGANQNPLLRRTPTFLLSWAYMDSGSNHAGMTISNTALKNLILCPAFRGINPVENQKFHRRQIVDKLEISLLFISDF
jgi:hypothetical protein